MQPLTTDLAQQILALVKMEAYSLLGAIQDGKTVLGGSAGSAGGAGEPPAGFVGKLTQSNVTFDTAGSSRACSAGSAGSSSLVDNLDAIRLGLEICDDAIGDRHIDWGHGAGQVDSADMPFTTVTFDGPTTGNIITVPEQLAQALNLVDTNAWGYMRIISLEQYQVYPTIHLNYNEAAMDVRISAQGMTNAFFVKGISGAITMEALGAGVVQASAIGVLSSSLLAADQLDLGIGDMLFNAADGLLLLGPHCEINPTEWWSLRKQKATISGAFHQEAGRWQGTRGLVVEAATTNMEDNPSLETNATGWAIGWNPGLHTTVGSGRSSDAAFSGDYSYKLIATGGDGVLDIRAGSDGILAVAGSTTYTFSAWVNITSLTSGNLQIKVSEYDGGVYVTETGGTTLTAVTPGWVRFVVTKETTALTDGIRLLLRHTGTGITYYADAVQVEQKVQATTFADGSLGTGYAWTGVAHASTSTRTVTEVDLDAHVGLLEGNDTMSFRLIVQAAYDYDATWPTATPLFLDIYEDADNRIFIAYSSVSDKIYCWIESGGTIAQLTPGATTPFSAGDWLDIILTIDYAANSYVLYLDGEEIASSTTALANIATLSQWNVVSRFTATSQTGWNVAEFAVFDRVLTAIEVAGLYALQRPLVDAGSLDEPSVYFTTVFNDLFFPMSTGKVGGANQPTWAAFQGNTMEYTFAINDLLHLATQEIAHSYKEGSDILLHVHIVLDGSDVGDTVVNYEVEYTIGDQDEVMSAAVVVTSGDFVIDGGTADRMHLVIDVGTIAGATYRMQAALKIRFRRIALVGGGDAPSNDPFVLMAGAHIEEDTAGSRTANTK